MGKIGYWNNIEFHLNKFTGVVSLPHNVTKYFNLLTTLEIFEHYCSKIRDVTYSIVYVYGYNIPIWPFEYIEKWLRIKVTK